MTVVQPESEQMLSVVIVVVSDTTDRNYNLSYLEGCLNGLRQQIDPPPLEILVPYPAQGSLPESFKEEHPGVRFLPVSDLKTFNSQGMGREHHDELRARGIAAASGVIVALLEDHGCPDPGWSRAVMAAHRNRYAAVGGAIENGVDRPLNWAVYFSDFGKYQNPVSDGESLFASDANISYKRSALESIKESWKDNYHETEVNWALAKLGEKITLSPRMVVFQHRENLRLSSALQERFIWGRSYAVSRSRISTGRQRLIYALISPVLPALLLLRMTQNAVKKRRTIKAYIQALPFTALLTVFWSLGELSGYLAHRPSPVSFQGQKEIPQP